jgi:hypothetical protein
MINNMTINTTFKIDPDTIVYINGMPYIQQQVKRFTNLIIIDASGSMVSKVAEVQGGLKQIFKDIKAEAVKNPTVITTTIVIDFSKSGDYRELVNSTNPDDLTDSIADSYTTRSMTALYDAIGFAFSKVPANQDGVFVSILTDGLENDSKEVKTDDVKKLIQKSKEDKWVVTFMGTTEACLDQAVSLGISRGNTMAFMDSGEGVTHTMSAANATRTAYYTTSTSGNSKGFDVENAFFNTKK